MNKWSVLPLIAVFFILSGCGSFSKKELPVQAQGGETATAPVIIPETVIANSEGGVSTPPVYELPSEPTPVEVPRVKQAQIVGILREMRNNGCIIKKVANTDGIHFSQLVITCDELQEIPEVD